MRKFWLVCLQEYKHHVLTKRFLFGVLSMPLFVGAIALVSFFSVWIQYDDTPVGYVDTYKILESHIQPPKEGNALLKPIAITEYADEFAARAALDRKEIQAYYVLGDNYMSTGEVKMVSAAKTGMNIEGDFGDFLRFNLINGKPEQVVKRLTEGTALIVRSEDGTREIGTDDWMVMVLPIVTGLLFVIAVNVSGGYLLQAVVEEKENRTMEILVTSISPNQLMAGKIIGNLSVGLTQLIIWILFTIIAVNVLPIFIPMGKPPQIPASYLLLLAGTFLPAFVMVAAAMGAVGATATEMREAQQVAGIFTIPIVIPFWFITAIMMNPNGGIAVALSLFPMTAPLALQMRAVFTVIPAWQLAFSITSLIILALFSLWLAGRVFRLGMLRYGKKVNLLEAFRKDVR